VNPDQAKSLSKVREVALAIAGPWFAADETARAAPSLAAPAIVHCAIELAATLDELEAIVVNANADTPAEMLAALERRAAVEATPTKPAGVEAADEHEAP